MIPFPRGKIHEIMHFIHHTLKNSHNAYNRNQKEFKCRTSNNLRSFDVSTQWSCMFSCKNACKQKDIERLSKHKIIIVSILDDVIYFVVSTLCRFYNITLCLYFLKKK